MANIARGVDALARGLAKGLDYQIQREQQNQALLVSLAQQQAEQQFRTRLSETEFERQKWLELEKQKQERERVIAQLDEQRSRRLQEGKLKEKELTISEEELSARKRANNLVKSQQSFENTKQALESRRVLIDKLTTILGQPINDPAALQDLPIIRQLLNKTIDEYSTLAGVSGVSIILEKAKRKAEELKALEEAKIEEIKTKEEKTKEKKPKTIDIESDGLQARLTKQILGELQKTTIRMFPGFTRGKKPKTTNTQSNLPVQGIQTDELQSQSTKQILDALLRATSRMFP